ncbi:MAG: hypothetical protein WEB13_03020 [Dehalococcoidia bacterium]
MISLEDMIAISQLDEMEIDALAEHEHIPESAAAALGAYLLHTEHGEAQISEMIFEDIEAARGRGDIHHAAQLKLVLRHFVEKHGGS